MKAFFFGEKIIVATKLYEILKIYLLKFMTKFLFNYFFLLPKDS